MTTTFIESSAASDGELVGLSLRGDRGAYEQIVERHKGLICALTYSACGDVHTSEDLAQETFFQGWKHLGELKEPGKVRGWLAGIARNVAASARRKRLPVTMENEAMAEMPMRDGDSPAEQAMSAEEFALMWGSLQRLPETYREPLVLYYRENESVAAVAEALELSEDAVKQRLARGRALLAERVEKVIREGLRASAPTKAFTVAVLAGISGMTVSASAATAAAVGGGVVVKGSGGAKGVAIVSGFLGATVLGPGIAFSFLGMLPNYWAYRAQMNRAVVEEERKQIKRHFRFMTVSTLAFAIWVVALAIGIKEFAHLMNPRAYAWTVWIVALGVALGYAAGLIVYAARHTAKVKKIRARYFAEHPEERGKIEEQARYLGEHPEELAEIIERPYRCRLQWLGDSRVVGWMLPRTHRATRMARFKQTPAALFAAITQPQEWRPGFTPLADVDGRRRWLRVRGMMMVFEEMEKDPPRLFRWRIVNTNLPFTGGWTWEIEAVEGGCECRITEEGETLNPIFRFMGRFVFGFTRTMEGYLRGLGRKFGEEVRIER